MFRSALKLCVFSTKRRLCDCLPNWLTIRIQNKLRSSLRHVFATSHVSPQIRVSPHGQFWGKQSATVRCSTTFFSSRRTNLLSTLFSDDRTCIGRGFSNHHGLLPRRNYSPRFLALGCHQVKDLIKFVSNHANSWPTNLEHLRERISLQRNAQQSQWMKWPM